MGPIWDLDAVTPAFAGKYAEMTMDYWLIDHRHNIMAKMVLEL